MGRSGGLQQTKPRSCFCGHGAHWHKHAQGKTLANADDPERRWEKSVSSGLFSVLFRVSSYPSILAESLVKESEKGIVPSFPSFASVSPHGPKSYPSASFTWRLLSCQAARDKQPKNENRMPKYNPGEIASNMHGISLMEQLQDQDVYAGIVPTIPNQSYEAMIQAKPRPKQRCWCEHLRIALEPQPRKVVENCVPSCTQAWICADGG